MATLSSPGVSVTVIDESFYTPAAPGTVPLIVVATAESKQNGAGTGTAPGTLQANAGQVYLLTSQKDLADTFGTPIFKTDANNNPIHAGEQNEYGLQAAYSYLGVSNRAYVVRADVNTSQLDASASAPAGAPADGQFWFDTASTHYGIFEWNSAAGTTTGGQTFTNAVPLVITDTTKVVDFLGQDYTPIPSLGSIGEYAVVAVSNLNKLWFKKPATDTSVGWVEVGSTEWIASRPTITGTDSPTSLSAGDTITINSVAISGDASISTLASHITTLLAPDITAAVIDAKLEIYSTGVDVEISGAGTKLADLGIVAGTYKAPALQVSKHTQVPLFKRSDLPLTVNGQATGSLWVKTTSPNLGADWIIKKYSSSTAAWTEQPAPLYPTNAAALAGIDQAGGGINLALGTIYVKYNDNEDEYDQFRPKSADFKIYARKSAGATIITSKTVQAGTFSAGSYTFTVSETIPGSADYTAPVDVTFSANGTAGDHNTLIAALQAALLNNTHVTAILDSSNRIVITHTEGGDIKLVDTDGNAVGTLFTAGTTSNFYVDPTGLADSYVATLWTASFDIASSADAPTTEPANGRLWYNSIMDEVDIMIHNGDTWVGYQDPSSPVYGTGDNATNPTGPIVSATKPKKQTDGSILVTGDLWVDTSSLENYPTLYRYNGDTKKWAIVDSSDQTTENGITFHDARWNTTGTTADASSIVDLLASNFLDPDAPDPAVYPRGMLLWNLRRSGFNVKKFVVDAIDVLARNHRFNNELMTDYYPNRWVSEAANQENGAGTFGRHAQRRVVIQALQALVNSNQQIRDEESRIFNLIACPGYPELIGEMISLNYDRGLTAFIVGDTPARLTPDATTLSNWGNNVAGAVEDNDQGLVSSDEYLGVFYPWGYTSDNIGNNIVVPPSHMMLRTIALSDNVSYPWFAPAGTRRGGITNATAVGYITSEGEFASVALNNGQRDTLASIKVNPLTFITGTGLVNYGQYTRAKNASALDRINVARLVIYLRRQFAQLAKPYVFEPNDKITRDEIKGAAESLLLELVGQRALYDYVVVCDTSNNTPSRIDKSELYLDVAIEPVKAVEFIYIPLRLKNTGEIKALGK
ncbi:Phage tail sheath C-terminal domain containing protein [uncultured Caudovirales phage]|uniref:Phage tail sheath C-terminal domain containing protein n=1 Tax=uncultured Caudovirales phage TaxID=2100421 RepID=A0A6J7WEY6_9CAUD|nr:Phage tail sheath C-terminal domain containing protein [uncultured Caudovirales phage]CAB5209269.1 Phage tail sheath C-terminal domain containing protein [uncultured Caudovirales phage]